MCHKCNGTGFLKQYEHVNNGVCYACDGTGGHGGVDISQVTKLHRALRELEYDALKFALKKKGCDVRGWSSYAALICEEYADLIKSGLRVTLSERATAGLMDEYPNLDTDIKGFSCDSSAGFSCSVKLEGKKIQMVWK